MFLRAFRTHGHLVADIDPLKLKEVYKDSPSLAKKFQYSNEKLIQLLDPSYYGFTEADMDREFSIKDTAQVGGSSISMRKEKWVLRELIEAYR